MRKGLWLDPVALLPPSSLIGVSAVQVLAIKTVILTAIGCLMFLDGDRILSSAGLSAIAVLLLIQNVFFLIVVAYYVIKRGRRHVIAFLRLAKTAFAAAFQILRGCFGRGANQPCLCAPPVAMAMPARASRSGSMQPMLPERVLSSQSISTMSR